MADTVRCPNCGEAVEVTEALSAQLSGKLREKFSAEWREKEGAIQASAELKARESISIELRDAQESAKEVRKELEKAQQAELDARKARRDVEEKFRTFELEMTRRLDLERSAIRDEAKRKADDDHRLKDAEKEKRIADLVKELENAKRKAEQQSQQLQGEILELDLEGILRQEFSADDMLPVPKGVHGGDIIHVVRDSAGTDCGSILWEFKRTKNWSDKWLPKLRDDQRCAKAHIAILVSDELPKVVTTFGHIDDVWVTNRACCVGLALAIRGGMVELAAARCSLKGQQGKMELLYDYLSSPAFRNRVGGIVEAFKNLRQELEAEKRAMNRLWGKREQQINLALTSTMGMYGDLQGIIGGNLPTIEPLELPAPEGAGEDGELLSANALPR